MLQVTQEARRHIERVREARGAHGEVPRLVGNGALVGFKFASQPMPDDRRVDSGGMPIYVDSSVADALDQTILDARPDDSGGDVGTTLVVRLQPGATFAPAGAE